MRMLRSEQWTARLKSIPKPDLSLRPAPAGERRAKKKPPAERLRPSVPATRADWEIVAAARILNRLRERLQNEGRDHCR